MSFPERVYTIEEVEKAKAYVKKGWKHRLKVNGSQEFKQKVDQALTLVKTARYYDFLRTYIREIAEIDGFSQLREAEVAIWANKEAVSDPVDAASFFIQKAEQMKDFLEDKLYYGGQAEARAVRKRLEFLETLKKRSEDDGVRKRCEEILKSWRESALL